MTTEQKLEDYLNHGTVPMEDLYTGLPESVRLANRLETWLIYSGRVDDLTPPQLNKKLIDIFGEDVINAKDEYHKKMVNASYYADDV